MIINSAPLNEAVLSNVSEVGEFRIRNSAKAFNILSSGLYANKIRAIIRELSCNAIDSHVAAGKPNTPFDVHLPTSLEPHFSIRDYGTGLSHEQVTNIYTTYFESTKTDSNSFIGALGLGSKSPFSYTDNFTVTAIQNGRKGIYTAFINDQGVPSIALMMEEPTEEPNGVEVKFAVNDRYDFDKFVSEARSVYTHFSLRPVVSGPNFEFREVEYESRDIIPGVHGRGDTNTSFAVMGNIAYPVDVPNPESLGELRNLLSCGLEMHFAIGELDFQASREGLSYIPQTIDAIKNKLQAVNEALSVVVAQEANAITNNWERSIWLLKKANSNLWKAAVIKYVTDSGFKLVNLSNKTYLRQFEFKHQVDMMARQFNISLLGFTKSAGSNVCSNLKSNSITVKKGPTSVYKSAWTIPVMNRLFFVVNDTRIGVLERAKYHWRNGGSPQCDNRYRTDDHILVLSPCDKTRPMKTKEFFASLLNPPAEQIIMASALKTKPNNRSGSGLGANVTIMKLGERGYGGYHKERELVWKDAGKASDFLATKTYYYLPIKGFEIISKASMPIDNVKRFVEDIQWSGIGLSSVQIYGVRKNDHAWVAQQKNWVNIQDHLIECFGKVKETELRRAVAKELDMKKYFRYNSDIADNISDNSPYLKFVKEFKKDSEVKFSRDRFDRLSRAYKGTLDVEAIATSIQNDLTAVKNRYPLLSSLRDYDVDNSAVVQYINLIDKEA